MKFSKNLTCLLISSLGYLSFCALADEEYDAKQQYVYSDLKWFGSGATIQELRDRSTTTFELLDQDGSSSITFDEINLSEMESEVSDMNNEELREYSRRVNAIHSKFMNWTIEFDEFEVVDTNGDGVWNKDEYEVRHQNLQSHRLELGLNEWDTDENGAVELHEFNSHLDELELLDENADGTVSHQEAFKSKNDNVISDVLNKLKLDEMIWASVKAVNADIEAEAEAKATRYMFIKQKEADKVDK
ncbi:MAG: hypothetical protein F4X56_02495 [Gammaproteobacteria bacterium]|nr:hypothetical protein [Gammaproteobacteria bacterium]MYC24770.1 hypothetical protein [Gammaproteobacteria bacterium]